jgi:hypothetical protein
LPHLREHPADRSSRASAVSLIVPSGVTLTLNLLADEFARQRETCHGIAAGGLRR